MKGYVFSLLVYMAAGLCAYADQVIYVEVWDFDRLLSQFDVEIKGNKWIETPEDDAINGTAFGGPGDNNHGGDGGEPYLIIKVPDKVRAGESTADGKKWTAWARLYVPQAVIDATNFNSFFFRMSADSKNWTPNTRGDTSLRWNDPGAMFPDSVNGVDMLFTDVGDQLPWFWEMHSANGQSAVDPIMAVDDNYIEIGIRESDPVNYPRIDVICLRNDGKQPSDAEALKYLKTVHPGEDQTAEKPATSWGMIKNSPLVYIEEQRVDIGSTFNVDVWVDRIKNLAGFQMSLSYDPYSLRFIGVQQGNVLSQDDGAVFWRSPDIDTEAGKISGVASTRMEAGGIDVEDGVLITLTFEAKELGRTMISLQDVKLSDPESNLIPFLVMNTFINVLPPWDVIPDMVVDIRDMVAVGQNLADHQLATLITAQGDIGSMPDADKCNPDVDRNGVVDVEDLILVSQHLGEVYKESNIAQQLNPIAELRKVYDLLNNVSNDSLDVNKLKTCLARLIAVNSIMPRPAVSRLLPSYPNPFNPDTWIPYHLAQAGDVTIRIYGISGQLIRTLDLGYMEAGFYISKDKAVYWDGNNDMGENLASGLYFCVMRAGDFTATRKMLLVK